MPYIKCNFAGEIMSVQENDNSISVTKADQENQGLASSLLKEQGMKHIKDSLTGSDSDMVRVIEDLIDLLIQKQVFVYTELPEAVQKKLHTRRKLRYEINPLESLINESDEIF